ALAGSLPPSVSATSRVCAIRSMPSSVNGRHRRLRTLVGISDLASQTALSSVLYLGLVRRKSCTSRSKTSPFSFAQEKRQRPRSRAKNCTYRSGGHGGRPAFAYSHRSMEGGARVIGGVGFGRQERGSNVTPNRIRGKPCGCGH